MNRCMQHRPPAAFELHGLMKGTPEKWVLERSRLIMVIFYSYVSLPEGIYL